jgi:Mg-chelatase subunit ChlI
LTIDDIRLAAELALPHRMRRQPFTEVKLDEGRMNAILDRANGEEATEHAPAAEGVKKKHP